jgi:hypothetical protein
MRYVRWYRQHESPQQLFVRKQCATKTNVWEMTNTNFRFFFSDSRHGTEARLCDSIDCIRSGEFVRQTASVRYSTAGNIYTCTSRYKLSDNTHTFSTHCLSLRLILKTSQFFLLYLWISYLSCDKWQLSTITSYNYIISLASIMQRVTVYCEERSTILKAFFNYLHVMLQGTKYIYIYF